MLQAEFHREKYLSFNRLFDAPLVISVLVIFEENGHFKQMNDHRSNLIYEFHIFTS